MFSVRAVAVVFSTSAISGGEGQDGWRRMTAAPVVVSCGTFAFTVLVHGSYALLNKYGMVCVFVHAHKTNCL